MVLGESGKKILVGMNALEAANSVDRYLADLFLRMAPQSSEALLLTVQLLSASTREGHVCLELGKGSFWEKFIAEKGWEPEKIFDEISSSSLGGFSENENTPLILSGSRLYLHRYFTAELRVARGLLLKAQRFLLPDAASVRKTLDRFFPLENLDLDMQKFAAFTAIRNHLCVITGGPGTGKTTTVCRILACLCELSDKKPEILLAAPTGKAASRLAASISEEKARLSSMGNPDLSAIPDNAFTLHRILGLGRRKGFSGRKGGSLSADIIVVDEASMVDLFLMAHLFSAMKEDAKLVLLGDRFQLASVSPGAVLGEICRGEQGMRSESFLSDFKNVFGEKAPFESVNDVNPMADCLVSLNRSWRFRADGGIGLFAGLLNAGQGREARKFLEKNSVSHPENKKELPEISFYPLEGASGIKAFLRPFILEFFSPYLKLEKVEEAFSLFSSFGLLSFLRKGPLGVEALNGLVEEILFEAGLIEPSDVWYAGRPVMIVQNDPGTGLFNGDIGLCREVADDLGDGMERLIFFPDDEGVFRPVSPMRLPQVEDAFCMTVHKSQGSEWDTLLLILPEKHSPILTREALYTGVTRSKKRLILAGDPESIEIGAGKSLFRASGLGDFLWRKRSDLQIF